MPGNRARGTGRDQRPLSEQAKRVLQRIKNVPTDSEAWTRDDFAFTDGTPGQRSVIAELQAERPHAIRHRDQFDLSITAKETFTTDGSGTQQTHNLSHDLLTESAVGESFVLFSGNNAAQADSVDYANDSFKYTDGGAVENLTVFYAAGDQALISVQKVAPNGTPEELFSGDVSQIHRRDHNENPLTMDLDRSPFQPLVPTDFKLEIAVNAPYTAAYAGDPDGDGTEVTAPNFLTDIPFRGAPSKVPELASVVRSDMAER